MSFEESMIEDGYHDEEEYIEHLMDEAENEWECQQNYQNSHKESCNDDYGDYDDEEEYYEKLKSQYQDYFKDNTLKFRIFLTWIHFDTEWNYKDRHFLLHKFAEWQGNEEWQTKRMKDYYSFYYPQIIKYLEWVINNPIEDYLTESYRERNIELVIHPSPTHPFVEPIPERDLIVERVNALGDWLNRKNKFEQWMLNSSDDEKTKFFNKIDEEEFESDSSAKHVRECVLRQLKGDRELDSTIEKVMNWYDEDAERGRNLFYMITCVQDFNEN